MTKFKKMLNRGIKKICPWRSHGDNEGNPGGNELSETTPDDRNVTTRQCNSQRKRIDDNSQIDYFQAKLKEKEYILELQAQKLTQAEDMLRKLQAENARLTADNSDLSRQLSNMAAQIEESRHLEVSSAELLDWIQSVVGYAGNKDLFSSDSEELSQFRNDAKQLPVILRRNGITCHYTPPEAGIGFLHKRDSRISNGYVLSAPMLLRDGVIVAEGILLVPANDNACSKPESKQETGNIDSAEADLSGEQSCNIFSATTSEEVSRDITDETPSAIANGDTSQETVPEKQEYSDHISTSAGNVVDHALIGSVAKTTQVSASATKSSEIASDDTSQKAVPEKQEYSDHTSTPAEDAVDQALINTVAKTTQVSVTSAKSSDSAKGKELPQNEVNTDNNSFYEFDF